jgi:ADP-heptose:LPS heptosyltransferase
MATGPADILLIRLKSIGDILFTLPAVNLVRDCFPNAGLTFLTSSENAPLLRGFVALNNVLTLDRALYRRKNPLAIFAHTLQLVRRLRRSRFSLVIDFQGYGETALLTSLTGAPQRWGTIYRRGRRWAYTSAQPRDDTIHPADWNLQLLQQCGLQPGPIRNQFDLPPDASSAALEFFSQSRLDPDRPTLFIQPFSSSPDKNWVLDKFLAFARHWHTAGLQVIFGGGPADRPALEPVSRAGFPVSAGAPVLTSAGLMSLSQIVLGPDTGLVHLAVALGKRVVMLIPSTAPGSPFPHQHPDWTVVPLAGQPVSSIGVEELVAAVAQALGERAANSLLSTARKA